MNNYRYTETENPFGGDNIWVIDDISLALGGLSSLVEKYINQYPHTNYSLSIFDNITSKTIEIDCTLGEMPQIIEYIYNLEKGTPLSFIGANQLTESYVVGMSICKGRIEFGCYKAENEKLIKISS